MTPWPPGRIPIWTAPLDGEALDSWLAAYAHRLDAAEVDLLDHLGLQNTRFDLMVRTLTPGEQQVLSKRTGVSETALTSMTLEPWNGRLVRIAPDRKFSRGKAGMQQVNAMSSFCPQCLLETDGRWQLSWRLPWAFACTRHHLLLLDRCPRCARAPFINKRRVRGGPGICIRGTGDMRCAFPLGGSPSRSLPADGLALTAQRVIDRTVLGKSCKEPDVQVWSQEVNILAQRVVRALENDSLDLPPLVQEALAECDETLPTHASKGRVFPPRHSMAAGITIAVAALEDSGHDTIFPWLIQADTETSETSTTYAVTWVHKLCKGAGPRLASRAMASLSEQVSWATQIRYGATTPEPAWPALTEGALERRAGAVPSMLWPGWTMRHLPRAPTGHLLASFRRTTAALLLIPGSETTYQQAARILHNDLALSNWRTTTPLIEKDEERWLATELFTLAVQLDAHGSPIDYRRRRLLFSNGDVQVDPAPLKEYCRQVGRIYRESLLDQVKWLVRCLLLGAEPGCSSRSPIVHWRTSHLIDEHLRSFIHQQTEKNLQAQNIVEPLQWEPPTSWSAGPSPSHTLPKVPGSDKVGETLALRLPLEEACRRLGIRDDQLRLYVERTAPSGLPVPPETSPFRTITWNNPTPPAPSQPDRNETLFRSRQELYRLYVTEQRSGREVARMVGCSSSTLYLRLKELDIPRRQTKRTRREPWHAPTREDLHRLYVVEHRSTPEIARLVGCSASTVGNHLEKVGIPRRRRKGPLRGATGHW
ncbi:TniQ family protein [Streptomyces sp. NPDC059897]|uniref:TniQ family protein n=1 Tax=Streptomyces sp. NPDC059897 TaxID=3346994 RepID=UPI00365C7D82